MQPFLLILQPFLLILQPNLPRQGAYPARPAASPAHPGAYAANPAAYPAHPAAYPGGRNAELAGGLSSNPILSGLRRTAVLFVNAIHEYVPTFGKSLLCAA